MRSKGSPTWRQFTRGVFPARQERRLGWLVPSLLRLNRGVYEIGLSAEVAGGDPQTPWPTDAFSAIKEIIIY